MNATECNHTFTQSGNVCKWKGNTLRTFNLISKVLNLNKLSKLGLLSIIGKCFDNDYNKVKMHTQRNTYNINYGHLNGR